MKTHIDSQTFSHIDIHHQTHNRGHINTLLTNWGQVMSHAQMFPRDNVADPLSWLSATCHEDGWRNLWSCVWWALALFMCIWYVKHQTVVSNADSGWFENVRQKLGNSARLYSSWTPRQVFILATTYGNPMSLHTGGWAAVNRAIKTVCSQVSTHWCDLLLVRANPSWKKSQQGMHRLGSHLWRSPPSVSSTGVSKTAATICSSSHTSEWTH